jgi:hypothetical protein
LYRDKLRRAELPFERGSPAAILQFPSRQQKTKSQIIYSKAKGTGGEKESKSAKERGRQGVRELSEMLAKSKNVNQFSEGKTISSIETPKLLFN